MMAIHHDVSIRVELLVGAAWHIAHRHQFRPFNAGGLKFPRLADIDQGEVLTLLRHLPDRLGIDFVIHQLVGSLGRASVVRLTRAATIQSNNTASRASRACFSGAAVQSRKTNPVSRLSETSAKKMRSRQQRVSESNPRMRIIQTEYVSSDHQLRCHTRSASRTWA